MIEAVPEKVQGTEDSLNNYNELDPKSPAQEDLRLKNMVELAKFSFELEEKREQSLFNQAGQMLTGFSVASAALLMGAPILFESDIFLNSGIKNRLILFVGCILIIILVSLLLAVYSQWRFKYEIMRNGKEMLDLVVGDAGNHVYQVQYDYQWIDQLEVIQNSKKENNDKRCDCMKLSMGLFIFAVSLFLIGLIILLAFIK